MNSELQRIPAEALPLRLREIPDAPTQLYVRGTLPSQERPYLAVVGSRAATPYGKQVVRELLHGLQGTQVVIVSGLAYGIDALAHATALEVGLTTVAVPGSGLGWNVLYPRANVNLAREILKAGGSLISEFEPEMKAADWTFPQRNRIMAGLCQATLVVEARERSGSLITARLTAEYNRDLLVVPGSIFSEGSRGTHQFLKLGATPITSATDLRVALGLHGTQSSAACTTREDLSETEHEVLRIITSPVSREALIQELGLSTTEANILLSAMEIKGLIIEEFGFVREL